MRASWDEQTVVSDLNLKGTAHTYLSKRFVSLGTESYVGKHSSGSMVDDKISVRRGQDDSDGPRVGLQPLSVQYRVNLKPKVGSREKSGRMEQLKVAPAALEATAGSSCPPLLRTLQLRLALRSRTF